MTYEEQKKCSELWQMASGEYIAPNDWTDTAADALAKFFAEVHGCSNAMAYVPKPSGSAPGWGWLLTYVYGVLKNRYGMNNRLIFGGCPSTGVLRFKSIISSECL